MSGSRQSSNISDGRILYERYHYVDAGWLRSLCNLLDLLTMLPCAAHMHVRCDVLSVLKMPWSWLLEQDRLRAA